MKRYPKLSAELEEVHRWLTAQQEVHPYPWLVAVSGGMDSMMLLHWLKTRTHVGARGGIFAVHVNHGLREEASLDARFVVDQCRQLGVQAVVKEVSLTSIPPDERHGTEADARRVRYDAIEEAAREVGAEVVLLAHHADDQMETVLWRLTRGTSATGVAGMRHKTFRSGIHWIRPLLRLEKAAISAYVSDFEVPYVEDATNASLDFTRNRIRHQIVPVLRELNPKVAEAFARQAEIAADEDAWLQSKANEAVEHIASFEAHRVKIDIPRLLRYPLPLQRRAITIILCCLFLTEWSSRHVADILRLCETGRPSASLALTDTIQAWREYEQLFIGKPPQSEIDIRPITWMLSDGGKLEFPNESHSAHWQFECTAWEAREGVYTKSLFEAIIPRLDEVEVRAAGPGDRVAPLGLCGTKKLQDVFVDGKVPRWLRDAWPVFCVFGQIIWLPGLVRSSISSVTTDKYGWRLSAKRFQ